MNINNKRFKMYFKVKKKLMIHIKYKIKKVDLLENNIYLFFLFEIKNIFIKFTYRGH